MRVLFILLGLVVAISLQAETQSETYKNTAKAVYNLWVNEDTAIGEIVGVPFIRDTTYVDYAQTITKEKSSNRLREYRAAINEIGLYFIVYDWHTKNAGCISESQAATDRNLTDTSFYLNGVKIGAKSSCVTQAERVVTVIFVETDAGQKFVLDAFNKEDPLILFEYLEKPVYFNGTGFNKAHKMFSVPAL